MKDPNGCTLMIKLRDGSTREWDIGASYSKDNEQTLRAHVENWLPGAELISFRWWTDETSERKVFIP